MIRIFNQKEIFIYTYKYTLTDYKRNHIEYFIIINSKFFIDKIISSDKINLKYNNPYFYFRESYLFKGKEKDEIILLVQAENRTFYQDKYVLSYL